MDRVLGGTEGDTEAAADRSGRVTATVTLWIACLFLALDTAAVTDADLAGQARQGLVRATQYLTSLSTHGGYLWEYTLDLKQRWGEGVATDTQVWVQPPGTPAVGLALLRAWQVTGDEGIRRAAEAAGDALIWGQLECGGWDYKIDFSPQGEKQWYYRHLKGTEGIDTDKLRNRGVFDDNTTQSATSLLIALSQATGEARFREAADYALAFLLRAQYDQGGWPQCYPLAGGYSAYYTFNDAATNDILAVLVEAWRAFGRREYLDAALRGGDFILLTQGPAPQAAWAQQYNLDLQPAWARKFEPPSWCSAVTARNIRTLVDLYLESGEEKYLTPIPAAIAWLEASRLADGDWARFYELGSNRPLYFTKDYRLTYNGDDCPTHYSFKGGYGVTGAIAYYRQVREAGRQEYLKELEARRSRTARLERARQIEASVADALARQDEQGRWVRGDRVHMQDFVRHIGLLAEYLECHAEMQP